MKFESCLGGVGNLKRHSPLFSWNTRVLSFNMGVFKQVNDQFCEENHGRSSSLLQKIGHQISTQINFNSDFAPLGGTLDETIFKSSNSPGEGGCIDVEASN